MSGEESAGWSLQVLEELELPTWALVPDGEDADEASRWADEQQEILRGAFSPHGATDPEDDLRLELEYALAEASTSGALATFQVWPTEYPTSVLCRVDVVRGPFVPQPVDGGRVVAHDTHARHLGPGRQYSLAQSVETESGTMDLVEVVFVFSDDEVSLVLGLTPSLAPIIAPALPGLALLADAVGLQRPDHTRFAAVPSPEATPAEVWTMGAAQ